MPEIDVTKPSPKNWLGEQWQRFLSRSEGSTAVEYAVMMALIAAVTLASVRLVGSETAGLLNVVASELRESGDTSKPPVQFRKTKAAITIGYRSASLNHTFVRTEKPFLAQMTWRHLPSNGFQSSRQPLCFAVIEMTSSLQPQARRKAWLRLLGQAEGSTAVEYAVMMALIAAVTLASVQMVGRETSGLLNIVAKELRNAGEGGAGSPMDAPPQAAQASK